MRERGRDQFASLPVRFAFAREKTIAQHRPRQNPQKRTLLEIIGALDQNFRNQLRNVNQNDIDAPETGAPDAGDLPAKILQHPEAVPEKGTNTLENSGHGRVRAPRLLELYLSDYQPG